jgi:hypothetical protein
LTYRFGESKGRKEQAKTPSREASVELPSDKFGAAAAQRKERPKYSGKGKEEASPPPVKAPDKRGGMTKGGRAVAPREQTRFTHGAGREGYASSCGAAGGAAGGAEKKRKGPAFDDFKDPEEKRKRMRWYKEWIVSRTQESLKEKMMKCLRMIETIPPDDHRKIFGLGPDQDIDEEKLKDDHKYLNKLLHPDRLDTMDLDLISRFTRAFHRVNAAREELDRILHPELGMAALLGLPRTPEDADEEEIPETFQGDGGSGEEMQASDADEDEESDAEKEESSDDDDDAAIDAALEAEAAGRALAAKLQEQMDGTAAAELAESEALKEVVDGTEAVASVATVIVHAAVENAQVLAEVALANPQDDALALAAAAAEQAAEAARVQAKAAAADAADAAAAAALVAAANKAKRGSKKPTGKKKRKGGNTAKAKRDAARRLENKLKEKEHFGLGRDAFRFKKLFDELEEDEKDKLALEWNKQLADMEALNIKWLSMYEAARTDKSKAILMEAISDNLYAIDAHVLVTNYGKGGMDALNKSHKYVVRRYIKLLATGDEKWKALNEEEDVDGERVVRVQPSAHEEEDDEAAVEEQDDEDMDVEEEEEDEDEDD